jgi:hypothetical protein
MYKMSLRYDFQNMFDSLRGGQVRCLSRAIARESSFCFVCFVFFAFFFSLCRFLRLCINLLAIRVSKNV